MSQDSSYLETTPIPTPTLDPLAPLPLITGAQDDETLTGSLLRPVYVATPAWWWGLFLVCGGLVSLLFAGIAITLIGGIGEWGNNIPVAWAYAITNFVWWIGFGHAGTLISAILVVTQQKWRASINRFAEAMTICAVVQAGLFPVLHLGRPWRAYWLAWYPSSLGIWPQFRSSLPWDFVAVTAYLSISLVFWYVGLLPDLAAARDHAPTKFKRLFFGSLALGWRNSARTWHHWKTAYLLLAGLATALVVSVESIVSFDFSIAQLPGWHATIFPPYFVASAMQSGFALLLVLVIPARRAMHIEHAVTEKHIDLLAKMTLAFSFMSAYGIEQEHFLLGWYSGDQYEIHAYAMRRSGPFLGLWLAEVMLLVVAPQLFWNRRVRRSHSAAFGIGLCVCIGAWLEQFIHVVPALSQGHLPSMWHWYAPSWVDWSILAGTIGFFGFLFLLFLRFIPAVPISDLKKLHHELLENTLRKVEHRMRI
jgi:Ni/Fe-hydrogenase subunit HybB-like protein